MQTFIMIISWDRFPAHLPEVEESKQDMFWKLRQVLAGGADLTGKGLTCYNILMGHIWVNSTMYQPVMLYLAHRPVTYLITKKKSRRFVKSTISTPKNFLFLHILHKYVTLGKQDRFNKAETFFSAASKYCAKLKWHLYYTVSVIFININVTWCFSPKKTAII